MKHSTRRDIYPRVLSEKERSFTRWLIEHANVSGEEKKTFLSQLESATVTGMCGCGCASIDLAINDVVSESAAPLLPFGDFIAKDRRFGVFVFSKSNRLAGVEIYSLADVHIPSVFPAPEALEAFEEPNQPSEPPR